MDVGDDSTTGDLGGAQGVKLLITTDGQLQVAGSHTLYLEVLGGVTSQLEDFSAELQREQRERERDKRVTVS